jgi:hypothetical protein
MDGRSRESLISSHGLHAKAFQEAIFAYVRDGLGIWTVSLCPME